MGRSSNGNSEAGFAKLHGEDFEYYMQTYSILLGRNSKKSTVDVDLFRLGGGMNISRHHARIFYDFERQCFSLEVLGKNGCLVNGVLHLPGNQPVKLVSQDLVQIGDMEFYFLLPVRSILGEQLGQRNLVPGIGAAKPYYNHHEGADGGRAAGKKGRGRTYDEVFEDMEEIGGGSRWKKLRRDGYMVMVARRVHAEDWKRRQMEDQGLIVTPTIINF